MLLGISIMLFGGLIRGFFPMDSTFLHLKNEYFFIVGGFVVTFIGFRKGKND